MLILFLLLVPFISEGQNEVQQNSVQLNASWNKGDTLKYLIQNFTIQESDSSGIDTLYNYEHFMDMVVLDSSRYGYIVEWQYRSSVFSSDYPIVFPILILQYQTDSLGGFSQFLNLKELRDVFVKQIEAGIMELEKRQGMSNEDEDRIIDLMMRYGSLEGIASLFYTDLDIYHNYYGLYYLTDKTLIYDDEMKVHFMDSRVPAISEFYLSRQKDDRLHITHETRADQKALHRLFAKSQNELGPVGRYRLKNRMQKMQYLTWDRKDYVFHEQSGLLLNVYYTQFISYEQIESKDITSFQLLNPPKAIMK